MRVGAAGGGGKEEIRVADGAPGGGCPADIGGSAAWVGRPARPAARWY